jgi:hypothetical protein
VTTGQGRLRLNTKLIPVAQFSFQKIGRWSKSNTSSRVWAEVWVGRFFLKARNDKALNNQGFVVHKMAEAMGFELMDLLQSTVFKSAM